MHNYFQLHYQPHPPSSMQSPNTRSLFSIYRSVPLIRPPILYTTSSLKWGEGLYSNMQLVSNISPPSKSFTRSLHNGMPFQITMATSFRIESTVRGHHVYKASWSPYIGEELPVQCEVNNIHDDFAVAVLKNSNTVGHVPREISRVCWYFLHKSGNEMTCIVNGDRRRSEVDGKDSWFLVCTSSKGNINTLRD